MFYSWKIEEEEEEGLYLNEKKNCLFEFNAESELTAKLGTAVECKVS